MLGNASMAAADLLLRQANVVAWVAADKRFVSKGVALPSVSTHEYFQMCHNEGHESEVV